MTDFVVPEGMPRAIFEAKYSRKKPDGSFQTWAERVTEVVKGNCSLHPTGADDYERLLALSRKGVIPWAGRHLQQGDLEQRHKQMEIFTNCSTAMASFIKFWLLMKGSGVGRAYDSDICRVDWQYVPNARFVLSSSHPDYENWIESAEEAKHKYGDESEAVRWFEVEDSAEGWVKVVEVLETAAFQEKHRDKLFIFDFSRIRKCGAPIAGQQGRPASGPVPLIRALNKVATIKTAGMKPWKQAMFIDHFLAECVVLGGVRRSARIATKSWRDRDVIEFIDIKRGGWLYTANNSVTVDEEFWEQARNPAPSHGRRVYEAIISASYHDGTGEPGFLDLSNMTWSDEGVENITADTILSHAMMQRLDIHHRTKDMLGKLLEHAKRKKYPFLVNPCVTADTWIETSKGPQQVRDLVGVPFDAVVEGKPYKSERGFFSTGTKQVFKVVLNSGHVLRCTGNHRLLNSNGDWVTVDDLEEGDVLALEKEVSGSAYLENGEDFARGWLVGEILGDGGHNPEKYPTYLRFWGEGKEDLQKTTAEMLLQAGVITGPSWRGGSSSSLHDSITVALANLSELADRYLTRGDKNVLPLVEKESSAFVRGFIRGLFDADGSVQGSNKKGLSVRLSQSNLNTLQVVQRALQRFGILSRIYKRREEGIRTLPDGAGGEAPFFCKRDYELVISREGVDLFSQSVGFFDRKKKDALAKGLAERTRSPYKQNNKGTVVSITPVGEEEVFDCTINDVHAYVSNGLYSHNCGEIVLAIWGGYCVIGDICLGNADTEEEIAEAVQLLARALMRVNLMPSLYKAEVDRTNRIGVCLTGIHEWIAKNHGDNVIDVINDAEHDFRFDLSVWNDLAVEAADNYADLLHVAKPHTVTSCKPSGSVSKALACTEGAHAPAYDYYLRWVQYRHDDPALADLEHRGYPIKDISHAYPETVVVGFPTKMAITDLLGEKTVLAGDMSLEQHYAWLELLEKEWLGNRGNNVSYTSKFRPEDVPYEDYFKRVLEHQPKVRTCSVMPQVDMSAYAYQPEERISKEEYETLTGRIDRLSKEGYDKNALECEGGACPIEFDIN